MCTLLERLLVTTLLPTSVLLLVPAVETYADRTRTRTRTDASKIWGALAALAVAGGFAMLFLFNEAG